MEPFVKWVGGKRNVIKNHLIKYLPKTFNVYYEPFVGGGSMLFYLKPKNAIINDINSELMITYNVIKDEHKKFIENMNQYKDNVNKEFYYYMRDKEFSDNVDIATRFVFLNKTCFNGIYRVNSKGKFNVPFNNAKNVTFIDESNIKKISQYFLENNIKMLNQDFKEVIKLAKKNDFIFCDPPYDYEINQKGFDSYTKMSFNQNGQKELCECLKYADSKGVKWMMTNHDTNLINNLYSKFKIIKINTNRSINSDGKKRKNTGKEVVVLNYEF